MNDADAAARSGLMEGLLGSPPSAGSAGRLERPSVTPMAECLRDFCVANMFLRPLVSTRPPGTIVAAFSFSKEAAGGNVSKGTGIPLTFLKSAV